MSIYLTVRPFVFLPVANIFQIANIKISISNFTKTLKALAHRLIVKIHQNDNTFTVQPSVSNQKKVKVLFTLYNLIAADITKAIIPYI